MEERYSDLSDVHGHTVWLEFEQACSLPCTYGTRLLEDTVVLLHEEEQMFEVMF